MTGQVPPATTSQQRGLRRYLGPLATALAIGPSYLLFRVGEARADDYEINWVAAPGEPPLPGAHLAWKALEAVSGLALFILLMVAFVWALRVFVRNNIAHPGRPAALMIILGAIFLAYASWMVNADREFGFGVLFALPASLPGIGLVVAGARCLARSAWGRPARGGVLFVSMGALFFAVYIWLLIRGRQSDEAEFTAEIAGLWALPLGVFLTAIGLWLVLRRIRS